MFMEKFSLEGKVAIITGAGRGLGRAQALEMAKAGADIVCAARTVSQIEDTAEEVRKLGRRAIAVPTDVTSSEQVNRLVERTIEEFGRVDILVNNAGGGTGGGKPIHELTDAEWHYGIDVNLSSTFYGCRAVYPHMVRQGKGKIINIASGWGMRGNRGSPTYSAAKAGIINFTRALAVAWARDGINVNCIAPGTFPTREAPPQQAQAAGAAGARGRPMDQRLLFYPLRRLGQPREIGYLAVFLASDASDYINGETILIDGGALAGGYAPSGYALEAALTL